MDIDNIDPGEDFAEVIEESVGSSDILIAVIGRHWLDACDPDGNRRLDNPDDFVRLEVSNALKRGIRVMPVLVDGAAMPRSAQLPEDLQPIIRRQAVEVTHNRFAADSERVIQAINRAFEKASAEEQERLTTEQRQGEEAEARERAEKERPEAEQRRREEKHRLVTPTLTTTPNAEFFTERAWEFYKKRDYDKAINNYTEAIRLNPNMSTPTDGAPAPTYLRPF